MLRKTGQPFSNFKCFFFVSLLLALEALMHRSAPPPLSNANKTLAWPHEIVVLYVSPLFTTRSSASRQWYLIHSLPIPPVVLKTTGGVGWKSLVQPLWPLMYTFTFSLVLVSLQLLGSKILIGICIGLTEPNIKYADLCFSQNPLACMSRHVSGAWFAHLFRSSPVTGCDPGSTSTS